MVHQGWRRFLRTRLLSGRKVRASFPVGSLRDCTLGTGCKHLREEEQHMGLLDGMLGRLVVEGNSCHLGKGPAADRSRRCRVVEGCSRGRIRQGCTVRCSRLQGLGKVSQYHSGT
jgi:hypothetical protein